MGMLLAESSRGRPEPRAPDTCAAAERVEQEDGKNWGQCLPSRSSLLAGGWEGVGMGQL